MCRDCRQKYLFESVRKIVQEDINFNNTSKNILGNFVLGKLKISLNIFIYLFFDSLVRLLCVVIVTKIFIRKCSKNNSESDKF